MVGASNHHAKWGYWLARGALAGKSRRAVYLVNGGSTIVHGEKAYPSIASLPEDPELVVLCVPPQQVKGIVIEALARGVRAFLGITAGVPEQRHLGEMIRAAGARIIGPNSLGLYDATTELQLAWGNFSPGSLAIVSQSGQLGSEIAGLGARAGLGVSRFVSIGNQLDVSAAEILEDLVDHEATRTVALYLESFAKGTELVRTLRALTDAGKKTLVLAAGASEASQRLARSHTGSLTSALDVVDAACRSAGAIRVSTPTELVSIAHYLSVAPAPAGRRVAVVSDSGGQGGIAADVAAAEGLLVGVFSPALQADLAAFVPAGAAVSNPVDLAGAGEADLGVYADLSQVLLESDEVDAVVLSGYFGCYGENSPATEASELVVVDRLGELATTSQIPLVVHSMSHESAAVDRMWSHGIPVFGRVESALLAISKAADLAAWPGRHPGVSRSAPKPITRGYWGARSLLADVGIPHPVGRFIADPSDLECAARDLSFPLVLKAGWLDHKSEHGGITLGVLTLEALTAAYGDMVARLGTGEYVVEEQDTRAHVVEVLVGGRRDRDFGPIILVGNGGVEAELHRDVCVELAPVDHATALTMIRRLRCLAVLQGWRGKPATDIDALASIVVSVSGAIAADDRIHEFEVNPVRVAPGGALAVDALIITAEPAKTRGRNP
ncbi:acetate--CoA ligase family protein [Aeromicrobium sp.]|uniref:acetate--CoA ligase family protein n=1 Tax=Aeromicrobium sp. TaxID=1871063 RepID=UPI0025BD31B5|nr:acetate--CoA ligase family protein [Aeromicrobium sp.]